ncbi:MAG: hypothetical protein GX952_07055 [Firmicutes bacterium]|nr:hypothetical protein [Bacillota bacterium]
MTVRGVEQIMPKADHIGRVQKIAQDGAAAERFVLELNRQMQVKRRSISELSETEKQRIKDPGAREQKDDQHPTDKKEHTAAHNDRQDPDEASLGRGIHLDIRA